MLLTLAFCTRAHTHTYMHTHAHAHAHTHIQTHTPSTHLHPRSNGFGEEVAELVIGHTTAKRYLVTISPSYAARLSTASKVCGFVCFGWGAVLFSKALSPSIRGVLWVVNGDACLSLSPLSCHCLQRPCTMTEAPVKRVQVVYILEFQPMPSNPTPWIATLKPWQVTLEHQGGLMTPQEVAEFEAHPLAAEMVALRLCDEEGKVPGWQVRWAPPFDDERPDKSCDPRWGRTRAPR